MSPSRCRMPLRWRILISSNRRSQYQNVLDEIDHNAGRIIEIVDTAGIADNTIVIFTSDNGPQTLQGKGIDYGGQSDSGPFRSEFPSAWEGAIRVPFIVRWPNHTKPRRVSNEIVSMLDMYRTFAKVAGVTDRVPTDRPIDSIDQAGFLFGDQEKSNRESVMFFHGAEMLAVKWRNFKVHFSMRDSPRGEVVAAGQGVITAGKPNPTIRGSSISKTIRRNCGTSVLPMGGWELRSVGSLPTIS